MRGKVSEAGGGLDVGGALDRNVARAGDHRRGVVGDRDGLIAVRAVAAVVGDGPGAGNHLFLRAGAGGNAVAEADVEIVVAVIGDGRCVGRGRVGVGGVRGYIGETGVGLEIGDALDRKVARAGGTHLPRDDFH
mgnify:CR=1 FL=1